MSVLLHLLLLATAFAQAPNPTTFRVRLAEDLGTLDWNYGEVNVEIVYQIMEGLFHSDYEGKPQKAIAQSFHWNRDKTALEVRLRGDRVWSDGAPVCAQHFVDSWNRLRSKEFASPYGHYATMLKDFSAEGCTKLHITFVRPAPEAVSFFTNQVFFPIRLDQLARAPKMFTEGTSLLVNGPFRVKEWKANSLMVLEQNPNYQGQKPFLKRVEYRFIPEDTTAKSLFELGQIDWLKDVPKLLRTPALEASGELRYFPALIVYYFGLNAGKASILEDASVRHALSDALEREEVVRILGKDYRVAQSWVPPELLPREKAAKKAPDPAAIEKLKKAAKAGNLKLTLRVYNKTQHKLLAEWAQGQWEKKLGIRIPIEVQEGRVYWAEIGVNPAPIFLSAVTAPFQHPRAFLQEFLSTSSANWLGWKSQEYDAAVNSGESLKAEELLEKEGFVIPLYQRGTAALVRKQWKGFFINPLEQAFLNEVK